MCQLQSVCNRGRYLDLPGNGGISEKITIRTLVRVFCRKTPDKTERAVPSGVLLLQEGPFFRVESTEVLLFTLRSQGKCF